MHAKGIRIELDRAAPPAPSDPAGSTPRIDAARQARAGRTRHLNAPPPSLLGASFLFLLAYAVTLSGLGTGRTEIAAFGLAAIAIAASALAIIARASIARLERKCERLGRARAQSERARHDLEVENAELERRNLDLRTRLIALVRGFDALNEQTSGRLYDLIEEAGEELAEYADELLAAGREEEGEC
jgi:hypothetical protein